VTRIAQDEAVAARIAAEGIAIDPALNEGDQAQGLRRGE
jgi:hypothetical protein